jgi:hypothetical protein
VTRFRPAARCAPGASRHSDPVLRGRAPRRTSPPSAGRRSPVARPSTPRLASARSGTGCRCAAAVRRSSGAEKGGGFLTGDRLDDREVFLTLPEQPGLGHESRHRRSTSAAWFSQVCVSGCAAVDVATTAIPDARWRLEIGRVDMASSPQAFDTWRLMPLSFHGCPSAIGNPPQLRDPCAVGAFDAAAVIVMESTETAPAKPGRLHRLCTRGHTPRRLGAGP